jgi:RimJ/RimL family protein N-acetyltransferase
MPPANLPDRITTPRLLLRGWRRSDAPTLKRAIDANLDHLRQWLPWAMHEPSALDVLEARLDRFAAEFAAGNDWGYAVLLADEEALVGGCGLHRRGGPEGLEIGYWIAADQSRKGFASEAAAAVTTAAFVTHPEIEFVEIRCDPRNSASAGVPRRLGYRLVETLVANTLTPAGTPRDTLVWRTTRAEWGRRRRKTR